MSALLQAVRRGEPLGIPDVIDVHGHLGSGWSFTVPALGPDGLVATMDRLGVRTVLCSHVSCMHGDVHMGNRLLAQAMRAHPGRIAGYVVLWPGSREEVAGEVRRRLDEGFTGVKLHDANGFDYTDDAYAPALAVAHERRLPVLLHTWGQARQFGQVRRLAWRYPDAAIILAHAGSRDLPGYVRLAREFANVHLDTCYSLAPRGMVARLVAQAGPDKVLFGSDCTLLSMTQHIGKVAGAEMPEADKVKVLSGNALRLLARIRH